MSLLPPIRPMGPRSLALAASILAALGTSTRAGTVNFSSAGDGVSTAQVATFDEQPGNALAQGAQALIVAAAQKPTGTVTTTGPFTLFYQANLILLDANGDRIPTGGTVFTAVAKFQETATVTAGSNTVTFDLAANQVGSYFDIFAHPSGQIGSNATGVGFASESGGVLIYSSTPGSADTNNFQNNGGSVNLDQSAGAPSGTGQQTVKGGGISQLTFFSNYINTNYFVGGSTAFLPSISFTSTNSLPFKAASPSAQFANLSGSGASPTLDGYIQPSLGTVNGRDGPDVQFEADASSTMNAVPEPASVAMTALGLGAAGLGGLVSRRRRAARA